MKCFIQVCWLVAVILTSFPLSQSVAEPKDPVFSVGELEVRKHLPAEDFNLKTLRLWPGDAPDEPRPIGDESVVDGKRTGMIHNVTQPSITIAQPKGISEPMPAVIVCPGGGYGGLGITVGGVDVILWLKSQGITGTYLKYRVPKRNQDYPMHHHPLQDIQRAVSMIRAQAADLQIDPKRIGVIGFSAGGNLAAMLATHHRNEDRLYKEMDATDRVSCRPDFVMLVAPAYLTMPITEHTLVPQLQLDHVARNLTPPFFITSATTDKFTIGASLFALALREKRVPVESHFYERGGHAEGIHDGPDNQWPRMCEDWMRRRGIISPGPGK